MDNREIWDSLFEKVAAGQAKAVGYWSGGLILAAISAELRPKLMVEVLESDHHKPVLALEGLHLSSERVDVDGRISTCLGLTSKDEKFDDLFFTLAEHIVATLKNADAEEKTLDFVENAIEEWVSFFKEIVTRGSREAILGLVGELLAIRDVLDHENLEPQFWQGPTGAIHDFRFPQDRLEVKVLGTRTGPRSHRISSLDQLVIPTDGKLYLLSFRATLSENAKESVHSLVDDIRRLPPYASVAGKKYFEECLKAVGYSADLDPKWSRFDLLDMSLYEVVEEFPRLTPGMVQADSRVVDIKYTLDLSGLDDLKIDLNGEKLSLN